MHTNAHDFILKVILHVTILIYSRRLFILWRMQENI